MHVLGFLIEGDFFQMNLFLQRVINAITNGAIYALLALAVVIIFRTAGGLNFAQGEMAMFSTFISYVFAVNFGWPIGLAILASIILSMIFGATVEATLVRPLAKRSPLAEVILTLGIFLILNQLAFGIWGGEPRPDVVKPFPDATFDQVEIVSGAPNVVLRYESIGIIVVLALLVVGLIFLLQKTKVGLAYRAVASNKESSQLVGIPASRMLMLGWALAAGIGAIAGALVSNNQLLEPNFMAPVLLFGFSAACLGGFDSIGGAVIGGLIMGAVEAFIPGLLTIIEGDQVLVVAVVVILIVLLARPQGLFGSKKVERV
jgi:branched-chain amino acid transport system permease protein